MVFQCYSYAERCDSVVDCVSGGGEKECRHLWRNYTYVMQPPAHIFFNREAMQKFAPINTSDKQNPCLDTHFQCPGDGYCLPVYFRCNGIVDCPGREDEVGCDVPEEVTCPGFYRCHSSTVCLHVSNFCDDIHQCPKRDDELFCNLTCPLGCTCQGLSFACLDPFPVHQYPLAVLVRVCHSPV
jgi:hypothetical protein